MKQTGLKAVVPPKISKFKVWWQNKVRAVLQQSPVAPGTQLLLLGDQKISEFSYKSFAGHPRFYRFRALGSLQFSLEQSLESAKIADCTDKYKQHLTLFDFSVIVSKNDSISGNLSCVFKLSKSDGCPFLLKSFMKLKYKRWAYNHSLYGDCLWGFIQQAPTDQFNSGALWIIKFG